jgi:hypothetical protein
MSVGGIKPLTQGVLQSPVDEQNRRAQVEHVRKLSKNPLMQGVAIDGIVMQTGINKIPHPLRRPYNGRIITKNSDSIATLYDEPSNDSADSQIWLNFAGTPGTTINLWVY